MVVLPNYYMHWGVHPLHAWSFIHLITEYKPRAMPCPGSVYLDKWDINSYLHNNETRAVIRSIQIVLMGKQGKKLPAMSVRVRAGFLEEVTASWNESNSYRNREGGHSSGGTTQCNSTGVQKSPAKETVLSFQICSLMIPRLGGSSGTWGWKFTLGKSQRTYTIK